MPGSHAFPPHARMRQLPSNWQRIRRAVLDRDGYACTLCGHAPANGKDLQADHIGDRNDHSLTNLRTLCRSCHLRRSASQGGRATAKRRKPTLRPEEPHPGALT